MDNNILELPCFFGKPQISRPPAIGGSSSRHICALHDYRAEQARVLRELAA